MLSIIDRILDIDLQLVTCRATPIWMYYLPCPSVATLQKNTRLSMIPRCFTDVPVSFLDIPVSRTPTSIIADDLKMVGQ